MTKGVVRQATFETLQKIRGIFKNRLYTLDRSAAFSEALDCCLSESADLRIYPRIPKGGAPGDPPIARLSLLQQGRIVDFLIRQRRPITRVGLRDAGKHQRRVGHGSGHWAEGSQRAVGSRRIHGDAAAARFQAENAAKARRDSDRAAGIGSERKRSKPGSDSGAGPSARTPG